MSDGGGVVHAARRPIEGRDDVARFVLGALRKYVADVPVCLAEVNGAPALVFGTTAVLVVEFAGDGRVAGLRSVVNPQKLEFVRRQLSHS